MVQFILVSSTGSLTATATATNSHQGFGCWNRNCEIVAVEDNVSESEAKLSFESMKASGSVCC
jgi:hypothetical protein